LPRARSRPASQAKQPAPTAGFLAALTEPTRAKLAKLGLRSAFDLVLHLPLRYEDETRLYPLVDLPFGKPALTEGELLHSEIQYRPRRQLVCQITDGQALLHLRFLNFYSSQVKQLQPGVRLRVMGEQREGFLGPEMVHPRYQVVKEAAPLAQSLTPVYPTTAGLPQQTLRRLIEQALRTCSLEDTLPAEISRELKLADFASSVQALHHPAPDAAAAQLEQRSTPAWRRLKFDELLAQQLSMRLAYRERRRHRAPMLEDQGRLTRQLIAALPFKLTNAQERAVAAIDQDLATGHPMQRLLQGDVGSGKTIVAALACARAIENGYQAALMAPTEILAEQHFRKIDALLTTIGVGAAWLAGKQKKSQRTAALAAVASGEAQLVIGTHALIEDKVEFQRLGLAVIDEQHRFGVGQRLALQEKGLRQSLRPHQLMMSATPIPRTLSMTYFADLDLSVLDELPPGRKPILTKLVADNRRDQVVARVREACKEGAQAYWVCPLIEESDTLQLQTAIATFENIRATFPDLAVGLLHGRMSSADKQQIMAAFEAGRVQLLVATTVIEVGVDVPNASLMVIENAERRGLSQLHQLRGRVGRGTRESVCLLLYQNPLSEAARARLKVIYENADGFEIARQDLLQRGPGEFLGARQSGVPLLRFADLEQDLDLLEQAREVAGRLMESDLGLAQRHLDRWLGGKVDFLKT
jgi:ATP-dependent DNA helicase RecG